MSVMVQASIGVTSDRLALVLCLRSSARASAATSAIAGSTDVPSTCEADRSSSAVGQGCRWVTLEQDFPSRH